MLTIDEHPAKSEKSEIAEIHLRQLEKIRGQKSAPAAAAENPARQNRAPVFNLVPQTHNLAGRF